MTTIITNQFGNLYRWACLECRRHGQWQASETAARMDGLKHLCIVDPRGRAA
jgi:hypothetical protein